MFQSDEIALIVDDDRAVRSTLANLLRASGYRVLLAATPEEARSLVTEHRPTVAILDVRLGFHSGLTLLRELLSLRPGLRAVIYTAHDSARLASTALKVGASAYLTKPVDNEHLLAALRGEPGPVDTDAVLAEVGVASYEQARYEHLQRVVALHCGNKTAAARALGIPRTTLLNWLRRGARKGS